MVKYSNSWDCSMDPGVSEEQEKCRLLQGRIVIMQKRGNQVRTIMRPKDSIGNLGRWEN